MKRLILTILYLLLSVPCFAQEKLAWMGAVGVGSGGSAAVGPVYTDCSNIGTASFYWNGDHSSGTTYGCKNTTTSVNGSLSNATVVASGTSPGTVSPESGGNCLLNDSGSDTFTFTITDLVDVTGAEGSYEADVYIGNASGTNTLLLIYESLSNRISLGISASNQLTVDHTGNSVQVFLTSTDTIPENTWTKVYARWSVANNKLSVKIGNGDWKDDVSANAVTTFSSNATLLRVLNSGPDTFYVDNIKLYTSSGF